MPEAFCGLETVRKNAQWTLCALWEKTLPRLREKTPQRLAWVLSYREDAFYFSQSNTEEQNTQRPTETLSQPISQNLTAIFGSNALWTLYAEGVLWPRNVGGKVLLNLWVLWEIKLPCESQKCSFSHREHRWTEHTGFHRDIKSTDFTEPYTHLLLIINT